VIKHRFELKINNRVVFAKDDHTYLTVDEAQRTLQRELWQACTRNLYSEPVGTKGSVDAHVTISWACTWNGRAPRRPADVIAKEKAERAKRSQARQAERAKWQAEADQRTLNIRRRISQQVDHAFALGKHGTEPAAKYITCHHCDASAAVVCLNQPIARGATVLDEETIVGALCSEHIQHTPYSYYSRYSSRDVVKVPCAKLEFFYDGVRQIAIKP
jgi:hypothetical protein